MCRKDLIGSKVFFDIIFSGFVPFLSRQTKDGKRQTTEVIDKECVTRRKKDENAVTTRIDLLRNDADLLEGVNPSVRKTALSDVSVATTQVVVFSLIKVTSDAR